MRPNRPRVLPNIQLMSAGATRDISMPAVVVVIPKHVKMMQNFLNTDSIVQNLCKPRDGATLELQVFACKDHSAFIGRPGGTLRSDTNLESNSDSDYLSMTKIPSSPTTTATIARYLIPWNLMQILCLCFSTRARVLEIKRME